MEKQMQIRAAMRIAAHQFGEKITLTDLAAAAEMPQNTLTRHFNMEFGMSPVRWLWAFRTIVAARFIMLQPAWQIREVSDRCGFNSLAHFSRRFREVIGMCPTEFRSQILHQGIPASLPVADEFRGFDDRHEKSIQSAIERLRLFPYLDQEPTNPWTDAHKAMNARWE